MSDQYNGLLDEEGKPRYEGQSPEVSSVKHQPGVYKDPESGAVLITTAGSKGVPHADALARMGWKRVGPVPTPEELAKMQRTQREKTLAEDAAEKAAGASNDSEGVAALKKQLAEERDARKKAEARADEAAEAATKAAKAAEEALAIAKQAAGASQEATQPPTNDELASLSDEDLRKLAETEGVKITQSMNTNEKIAEAIRKARAQRGTK